MATSYPHCSGSPVNKAEITGFQDPHTEENDDSLTTITETFTNLVIHKDQESTKDVLSDESQPPAEPKHLARKPAPIDTDAPTNDSGEPVTPLPLDTSAIDEPVANVVPSPPPPSEKNAAEFVTPPTPGAPPPPPLHVDQGNIEDDIFSPNIFPYGRVHLESVGPNMLTPREQEVADGAMQQGITAFFQNKFTKARSIFESRANDDPLYMLGLGIVAFIQALNGDFIHAEKDNLLVGTIQSREKRDNDYAKLTLIEASEFASAQIEAASAGKPIIDTVSHYISNIMGSNPTKLPTNTRPFTQEELGHLTGFLPNGALRAHVIRAECGLLLGMLCLLHGTSVAYLRAGLHLRRCYSSYSFVWQEYKRMGQEFGQYMDKDTISGIQFGIGAVHLLLSILPTKVLRMVSAFGWKPDQQLGLVLLKLCFEGNGIRSPFVPMVLMSYYVHAASSAPSVLLHECISPALECLADAQKTFPNSTFYLYNASQIARIMKDIPLSNQSLSIVHEVSSEEPDKMAIYDKASMDMVINHFLCLDWANAARCIYQLEQKNFSEALLLRFMYGACMEMLDRRSDAILAFADITKSVQDTKPSSTLEEFAVHQVEFYERTGYQDLSLSLSALELLLVQNLFPSMSQECLNVCAGKVNAALDIIYQRERGEYMIRAVELAPNFPPPDYTYHRAILLLIKASILNALKRYDDAIVYLNWIIDRQGSLDAVQWVTPFGYWESGITSWGLRDFKRSRFAWETAQVITGYDMEKPLLMRIHMTIQHCIHLGIPTLPIPKPEKGLSTHGRKRLSAVSKRLSSQSMPR